MTPMPGLSEILPWVALGLALGAVYFAMLHRTVRLHTEHAAMSWIAAHYILRIGAAVTVLILAARAGAWPLIATFAGFVVARVIVVRAFGGGPR